MPVEIRIVPTKRQWDFITCPADIILFGGARGGAKTTGSLLDFWYHAIEHGPNALGLMVRRQRTDLKDTQLAAMNMYGNAADWKEHGSYFQFKNGARLWFAYLESDKDAMAYQGFSLTRVYIEEVGQFPSLDPMWKLMATLRSTAGVKCQMRMTCNPGGPSHFALKSYFVDNGPDKIVHDPDTGLSRVFIPSKIIDNPHLLAADPSYINRLRASGSPELQRMWIDGDWDAGLEGQFFTEWSRAKHVIEPFECPAALDAHPQPRLGQCEAVRHSMGRRRPGHLRARRSHLIPRGALVIYREYYGMQPGKPNIGLKMPAEEVAREIVKRETDPTTGKRETVAYGVAGSCLLCRHQRARRLRRLCMRNGAIFRRADNSRVSIPKKMGGWSELRSA